MDQQLSRKNVTFKIAEVESHDDISTTMNSCRNNMPIVLVFYLDPVDKVFPTNNSRIRKSAIH